MSQQYSIWWTWCWLFKPEIEKYHPSFPADPGPEFSAKVNGIAAELQKSVVATLDRSAADARRELSPKIRAAFESAFAARTVKKAS